MGLGPLTRPRDGAGDLSPLGLRDSRVLPSICSSIADRDSGELVPASAHRLWTGWLVVAIPSSKARNDPGEPSKRAMRVWVLLACGVAFKRRADHRRGGDDVFVSDIGCGSRTSISGVDQLDCPRRCDERNGG